MGSPSAAFQLELFPKESYQLEYHGELESLKKSYHRASSTQHLMKSWFHRTLDWYHRWLS